MIDARSDCFNIGIYGNKPLKVIVSLVTLVAFSISIFSYDLVWAARSPSELTSVGSDRPGGSSLAKTLNVKTFSLPEDLGHVKEVCDASTLRRGQNSSKGLAQGGSELLPSVVIQIQDAHCNYYAQKKIAEIVEYLNTEYGISSVNLEGGAESYDLSIFTNIADKTTRRRASDHFVKAGLVSGAEHFAINNPEKISLWGVEDPDLYIDNLDVYRKSIQHKEEIDKSLKSLSYILTNLKMKIYSKELLEFDKRYTQYKAGNLDFKDYLSYLFDTAKSKAIDIKSFHNISLLNDALQKETAIDFKVANLQRDELIDRLHKRLSMNAMEELVAKTVAFKTEKISQKDFYSYLMEASRRVSLSVDDLSELKKYVAYVSIYDSMDKMKVMDEIDALEAKIKSAMFENDTERDLSTLSKNFALLKNIFNISLTRDDYRYFKANEDSFAIRNYERFIDQYASVYKITAKLDENIGNIDRYRDEISKFYEYSFKRDGAFVRNLKFGNSLRQTILITGGFHTENLCEAFKREGISYISIIPNFKSPADYTCQYFKILSGEDKLRIVDAMPSVLAAQSLATPSQLNPIVDKLANATGTVTAPIAPAAETTTAPAAAPSAEQPVVQTEKELPKRFGTAFVLSVIALTLILNIAVGAMIIWERSNPIVAILYLVAMSPFNLHIAEHILIDLLMRKPARMLPGVDYSGGIPDEHASVVTYAFLPNSRQEIEEFIKDQLIPSIEANNDKNIKWIILSPSRESMIPDEMELYGKVQEKYGRDRIFYFHRDRSVDNWDKKRGGLIHLQLWLTSSLNPDGVIPEAPSFPSAPTGRVFDHISGDINGLRHIENFLVADSDTLWYGDSVKTLISKMTHPDNKAFTIFMAQKHYYNRAASNMTFYTDYIAGLFRDYQKSHWNALGQISFTGWGGGWNMRRYLSEQGGKLLPGMRSHDIIESYFSPTALVLDAKADESVPVDPINLVSLYDRWFQGNTMSWGYLMRNIPSETGAKVENTGSLVNQYLLILCNKLQFLPPIFLALNAISVVGVMGFLSVESSVLSYFIIGYAIFKFFGAHTLLRSFKNIVTLKTTLRGIVFFTLLGGYLFYAVSRFVIKRTLEMLINKVTGRINQFIWVPSRSLNKKLTFVDIIEREYITVFLGSAIAGAMFLLPIPLSLTKAFWIYIGLGMAISPFVIWLAARPPPLAKEESTPPYRTFRNKPISYAFSVLILVLNFLLAETALAPVKENNQLQATSLREPYSEGQILAGQSNALIQSELSGQLNVSPEDPAVVKLAAAIREAQIASGVGYNGDVAKFVAELKPRITGINVAGLNDEALKSFAMMGMGGIVPDVDKTAAQNPSAASSPITSIELGKGGNDRQEVEGGEYSEINIRYEPSSSQDSLPGKFFFKGKEVPLINYGGNNAIYGFPNSSVVFRIGLDDYDPLNSRTDKQVVEKFNIFSSIDLGPGILYIGKINNHRYSVVQQISGYSLDLSRELDKKEIMLVKKLLQGLIQHSVLLYDFKPGNIMIGRLTNSPHEDKAWVVDPEAGELSYLGSKELARQYLLKFTNRFLKWWDRADPKEELTNFLLEASEHGLQGLDAESNLPYPGTGATSSPALAAPSAGVAEPETGLMGKYDVIGRAKYFQDGYIKINVNNIETGEPTNVTLSARLMTMDEAKARLGSVLTDTTNPVAKSILDWFVSSATAGGNILLVIQDNDYGIHGIGQQGLIAITESSLNNPVALFHEIGEAAIKQKVVTAGQVLAQVKDHRWYEARMAKGARDSMEPHYALRALQRELWPDLDRQLTERIKAAGAVSAQKAVPTGLPEGDFMIQMLDTIRVKGYAPSVTVGATVEYNGAVFPRVDLRIGDTAVSRRFGNIMFVNRDWVERFERLFNVPAEAVIVPVNDPYFKFEGMVGATSKPDLTPDSALQAAVIAMYLSRDKIRGNVFIDYGALDGRLGLLASKLGARRVVFVERAKELHTEIDKNAQANGIADYGVVSDITKVSPGDIAGSAVAININSLFAPEQLKSITKSGEAKPSMIIYVGSSELKDTGVKMLEGSAAGLWGINDIVPTDHHIAIIAMDKGLVAPPAPAAAPSTDQGNAPAADISAVQNQPGAATNQGYSMQDIRRDLMERYPGSGWSNNFFDNAEHLKAMRAKDYPALNKYVYNVPYAAYQKALEAIADIRQSIAQGRKLSDEQISWVRVIITHFRISESKFTFEERFDKIFPSGDLSYFISGMDDLVDSIDKLELTILTRAIGNARYNAHINGAVIPAWVEGFDRRAKQIKDKFIQPHLLSRLDMSQISEDILGPARNPLSPAEESELNALQEEVLTIGGQRHLIAHGVEQDKGGLNNLINIILEGQLRGQWFIGELADGDAAIYSGPHGPYYVVMAPDNGIEGNPSRENFFMFLVRNEKEKAFALAVLKAAAGQGLIGADVADSESAKVMTYKEFISRYKGKDAVPAAGPAAAPAIAVNGADADLETIKKLHMKSHDFSNSQDAIDQLVQMAINSRNVRARTEAIRLLRSQSDESTLYVGVEQARAAFNNKDFVGMLRDVVIDPTQDADLRKEAFIAIWRIDRDLFMHTQDDIVRDERIVTAIKNVVLDKSIALEDRRLAVIGLGKHLFRWGQASVVSALKEILLSVEEEVLKTEVIRSLESMPGSLKEIILSLPSAEKDLRSEAIRLLSYRIGRGGDADILKEIFIESNDKGLRAEVLNELSKVASSSVGSISVVKAIADIGNDLVKISEDASEDPELRAAAVQALRLSERALGSSAKTNIAGREGFAASMVEAVRSSSNNNLRKEAIRAISHCISQGSETAMAAAEPIIPVLERVALDLSTDYDSRSSSVILLFALSSEAALSALKNIIYTLPPKEDKFRQWLVGLMLDRGSAKDIEIIKGIISDSHLQNPMRLSIVGFIIDRGNAKEMEIIKWAVMGNNLQDSVRLSVVEILDGKMRNMDAKHHDYRSTMTEFIPVLKEIFKSSQADSNERARTLVILGNEIRRGQKGAIRTLLELFNYEGATERDKQAMVAFFDFDMDMLILSQNELVSDPSRGAFLRAFIINKIPEIKDGVRLREGDVLTIDTLMNRVMTDRRFSIPLYLREYVSALRTYCRSQKTFFDDPQRYQIDENQAVVCSYDATRDTSMDTLLAKGDGRFSGHLAIHQTKNIELLEAILTAGYIIPEKIFEVLNDNNQFKQMLREGKVGSLIGTEFVHFSVDRTIGYLNTPYALVYPVEMLLENQSFMADPIFTGDWAIGGFSANADHVSHRIPSQNAILLIPKSDQNKIETLFNRLEREYNSIGWKRPNKVFYYDGDIAATGLAQLQKKYNLENPQGRIRISRLPDVIRKLDGGKFKSDQFGSMPVSLLSIRRVTDTNGIVHYVDLPQLSRLSETQDLSASLEEAAREVLSGMAIGEVSVDDTGSSKRGTYQERHAGLPDDFDLMVNIPIVPDDDDLMTFAERFSELLKERNMMAATFGTGEQFEIVPDNYVSHRAGRSLIKLKVFRAGERSIPVLSIDVNFFSDSHGADGIRYQSKFWENMDRILSGLPGKDKEIGKQYILSTIRSLKAVFKNNSVYSWNEGGLRGVGTEQLVIQANGVTDEFGTPNPVHSIDELRKIFSVSAVLKILEDSMFDRETGRAFVGLSGFKDNLPLWDPGSLRSTRLTERVNEVGLMRFVDITSVASQAMPMPPTPVIGAAAATSAGVTAGVFAKDYAPGTYRTEVSVSEGEVTISKYDEKGVLIGTKQRVKTGETIAVIGKVTKGMPTLIVPTRLDTEYATGHYFTYITVFEGKVAVNVLDENGVIAGGEVLLTEGKNEAITIEGRIDNAASEAYVKGLAAKAAAVVPIVEQKSLVDMQTNAAKAVIKDLNIGSTDIIVMPGSEIGIATETDVSKRATRKFDDDHNQETVAYNYNYNGNWDNSLESLSREILRAVNKLDEKVRAGDGMARMIIYVPSDRVEDVKKMMAEFRQAEGRVSVVGEVNIPATGIIDTVMHIILGKGLLNYERYGAKMSPDEKSRLADFIKLLVSKPETIDLAADPDIINKILKGAFWLEMKAVDYKDIDDYKKMQDALLISL